MKIMKYFLLVSIIFIVNVVAASDIESFKFKNVNIENNKYDIESHKSIYYGIIPKKYYKESVNSWDDVANNFALTKIVHPAPTLINRVFSGTKTEGVKLKNSKYLLYSDFNGFTPVTALNYIKGINLIVELLTARVENSFALIQQDKTKLQEKISELPKYIEAAKEGAKIVQIPVYLNYYLEYFSNDGKVSHTTQEMKNIVDSAAKVLDTIKISDYALTDKERYFFGYNNECDFAMRIGRYLKDYTPNTKSTLSYFKDKLSNIKEKTGETKNDIKLYVKKVTVSYLFKTLLETVSTDGKKITYNNRKIEIEYLSAKLTDAFFNEKGFKNVLKDYKTNDDLKAFLYVLKQPKAKIALAKLKESLKEPTKVVENFSKAYKKLYDFVTKKATNINLSKVMFDLINNIPAYSETILKTLLNNSANIATDVATQIVAYAVPGAGQLKAAADLTVKGVVLTNKIAPYALDAFTAPKLIPLMVKNNEV